MNKKILLIMGGVLLLSTIGSSAYAGVCKSNSSIGEVKYITTATVQDNYFIIPYSSTAYLTTADLQGLTLDQLEIARNEIYARHGYQFQQQKMINYFSNQNWYSRSPYTVTTDDLSELEYANVVLIQQVEASYSETSNTNNYFTCSGFVIPDSSTTYLTLADLQGLTLDQLEIARNEIYARHGYQFQQQKMINYFSNQSWYTRSSYKITTDDLSELEYANVMLIQQQESSLSSGACGDYTYYCGNFVIPDSSYRKITSD